MDKNMSMKMNEQNLENLNVVKDFYKSYYGIEYKDSTLIKQLLEDKVLEIEKYYEDLFHSIQKQFSYDLIFNITIKNVVCLQLVYKNKSKAMISLSLLNEMLKKCQNCRNKSEIIKSITNFAKKTYVDTILTLEDINDIENEFEDDIDVEDMGTGIEKEYIKDAMLFGSININFDDKIFSLYEIFPMYETLTDVNEVINDGFNYNDDNILKLDLDLESKFKFSEMTMLINEIKKAKKVIKNNDLYYLVC